MAITNKIGSQAILRLTDAQVLNQRLSTGQEDLSLTDYLGITANDTAVTAAVVTRKVTLRATNDDATVIDVHLALAGKGAGVVLLPQIATASLPTAAAGNKGGIVYDSTTNTIKWSNGSAWATI